MDFPLPSFPLLFLDPPVIATPLLPLFPPNRRRINLLDGPQECRLPPPSFPFNKPPWMDKFPFLFSLLPGTLEFEALPKSPIYRSPEQAGAQSFSLPLFPPFPFGAPPFLPLSREIAVRTGGVWIPFVLANRTHQGGLPLPFFSPSPGKHPQLDSKFFPPPSFDLIIW